MLDWAALVAMAATLCGEGGRIMASRVGPGPVFVYESLLLARRWQVYAGRAVFVLAVLVGLWLSWWSVQSDSVPGATTGAAVSFEVLASAGERFYYSLAGIQLAMVLIAAPVATAGAICEDRAQGSWHSSPRQISRTPRSSWASWARGWPLFWGCSPALETSRIVLWSAILPAATAVIVAWLSHGDSGGSQITLLDRIAAPSLVVSELLAYGAAVTSTGLALATWNRRLGRAVAINVLLLLLVGLGWPLVVELVIAPQLPAGPATGWDLKAPGFVTA